MPALRPMCVCCGKRYGRRDVREVLVRWDTPTTTKLTEGRGVNYSMVVPVEPIAAPPPYLGNGIVIGTSHPYLSANDNRMVMHRHIWDGASFITPYAPFCSLTCALAYARAAYNAAPRRRAGGE